MSNNRNNQDERLAEIFKALSNPNRLKILQRLTACCPPGTRCYEDPQMRACVGEVGRDLQIAPSTVSHHIKELNQAGLIRMERRGQNIECWVDPETLKELADFFAEMLSEKAEFDKS